jgi:hypothetical protein
MQYEDAKKANNVTYRHNGSPSIPNAWFGPFSKAYKEDPVKTLDVLSQLNRANSLEGAQKICLKALLFHLIRLFSEVRKYHAANLKAPRGSQRHRLYGHHGRHLGRKQVLRGLRNGGEGDLQNPVGKVVSFFPQSIS